MHGEQKIKCTYLVEQKIKCTYLVQDTICLTIHAPGGIRSRNPSKRVAADQHLRLRDHWDRPMLNELVDTLVRNKVNVSKICLFIL
jgi:hypothetical protein